MTGLFQIRRIGKRYTILTSDLQETLLRLYEKDVSGPTIDDINYWLVVDEEKHRQVMTDEDIINSVLKNYNSKNEQDSNTSSIMCTVTHYNILSVFNICF